MPIYLGLDFGGTKLAVGLVDDQGALLDSRRRPTDPATGGVGAVEAMREMVDEMGAGRETIDAVGISFGGPVDASRTRTLISHHGPGWVDFPLVERIAEIWRRPVEMDNDANAAALGEARFGAAAGARNALYVTVSTGVGGGIIVDGKLYRGSRGLSGEIGHTIVKPGGPVCTCGKRGCVEAVAAGPSIALAYQAAARSGSPITAEDVFRLAASGDPTAQLVLDDAITYLGIGLANAINLLDPDVVVLGGGVTRAGDALFVPLRAAVRMASPPSPPDAVPIVAAALGDAVGILGAVALVLSG
jgi:glucokinase